MELKREKAVLTKIRDTDGTVFEKCRSFQQELTFEYATGIFAKHGMEFAGSYSALDLINPLASHFEGLYRKDTQGYPPRALREAWVNAIVHRDYDFSGPIILHVHDDRIEIVSLGGLVKGLPMEALHSHISQPRNPILANVFFRWEGFVKGVVTFFM